MITVDWHDGAARLWYPQAASNTRVVGKEISLLADFLELFTLTTDQQMWCVGHSLGAHTCGHAGKTGNFGRVTGKFFFNLC